MKMFSRILLTLLAVLLTVVLTVTSLSASLISCVRVHFTPGYVYNFMNSIDYATLELPDDYGNTAPLCDILNDMVREMGIYFTEDDVNNLVRGFSLDAVFASYMQELRGWALDDGPVPKLDTDEVYAMITSRLDRSFAVFLGLFGDPTELIYSAVERMTSVDEAAGFFENSEIVPRVLAEDFLVFMISVCASVFLLILFTQKMRVVPTAIYTGLSCIVSGSVMLFARQFTALFAAQLTDFAELFPIELFERLYDSFMGTVHRTGTFVSLGGLAVLIVFAVIGTFYSMYRRERERALMRQNRAVDFGTPYAQFNYSAPDYMAQGFENASDEARLSEGEEQGQYEPADEGAVTEETSCEESPASDAEDNKDTEY